MWAGELSCKCPPPLTITLRRFRRCSHLCHAQVLDQVRKIQQSNRTWKNGLVAGEPRVKNLPETYGRSGIMLLYFPMYRTGDRLKALGCPPPPEKSGQKSGRCLPWVSRDNTEQRYQLLFQNPKRVEPLFCGLGRNRGRVFSLRSVAFFAEVIW